MSLETLLAIAGILVPIVLGISVSNRSLRPVFVFVMVAGMSVLLAFILLAYFGPPESELAGNFGAQLAWGLVVGGALDAGLALALLAAVWIRRQSR